MIDLLDRKDLPEPGAEGGAWKRIRRRSDPRNRRMPTFTAV